MHLCKDITEYINSICSQIRWKKAHERIAEEIEAHIIDSRDAYIAQGQDEPTATKKAIADTGDATALGLGFDRIHRPKPQWIMLAAVAAFLAVGIVASLLLHDGVDIQRRLIFTAVGIVVMFAAYFADFTILGRHSILILFGVIVTAVALLIYTGGNWAHPILSVFPLLFPLVFAPCIFALRNKGIAGIVWAIVIYIVLCFTAALLHTTGLLTFMVAGVLLLSVAILKGWFGVNKILNMVIAWLPFLAITISGIILNRGTLTRSFNPHLDPLGSGFVALQTRRAISGAVFLGEGAVNTDFVPDRISNSLLTSVLSYYGWLPFLLIIGTLILFIIFGTKKAYHQKNKLGLMVSLAVLITFAIQVIAYTVYNLGLPIAIMSLPLISPGNAAMVVNMGLIGFMLSVFRTGDVIVEKEVLADAEQNKILTWQDGKLIINTKAFQNRL